MMKPLGLRLDPSKFEVVKVTPDVVILGLIPLPGDEENLVYVSMKWAPPERRQA